MMKSNDLSGRILSRYRIVKLLGKGGMGEVYLAEDTQLERTVALKVLPEEVSSDKERMRRFIREAKAASAIDHPNIVNVYEIGQADGVHFIAMQHVEGETLREHMNGKPVPTDQLLQIAIQITDALSEAHGRGIIHRDLKPANIMVSSKKNVKLLDFGLARIERHPEEGKEDQISTQSRTEAGLVVGTVAYMSPEQSLGNRIDQRSDIFSLGTVLYEMATGRHPFTGKNQIDTIDRIVHAQPESILRLNYDAPQELERIIRKCMEKDPDRRYQSSAEVLIDLKNLKRDLESFDRKETLSQPTISAADSGRRISRRLWIPIATVILIGAVSGFLFLRWRAGSGEAIRALAVLPFKNVNLDPNSEYLGDGITDSIINNLSRLGQLRVMARSTVFSYKNKEVDPREVGKELSVDGVVAGKLLRQGNAVVITVDFVDARDGRQIWGEQYNRNMADLLKLQSEISKEISEKLRIHLTGKEQKTVSRQYTQDTEAYQLYLQGQFYLWKRTVEGTTKAMGFYQQAIERDPKFAPAYNGVASCYLYLGITGALLGGSPPREVMPKAKEYVMKALQLDETLSDAHATLGNIHANYDWDWEGTERETRKALELNPSNSFAWLLHALHQVSAGKNDQALDSLEHFKKLEPGVSPASVFPLGLAHYWMRDYDLAIEYLKRALEMEPRLLHLLAMHGMNFPT